MDFGENSPCPHRDGRQCRQRFVSCLDLKERYSTRSDLTDEQNNNTNQTQDIKQDMKKLNYNLSLVMGGRSFPLATEHRHVFGVCGQ